MDTNTEAYLGDHLSPAWGEFIALRRDIHAHPELGFEEHRTSALVAQKLEGWGYEVTRGLGGTGLVGTLRQGQGQRRLGIRADMDALPILENPGPEWVSRTPGRMHACGHDGHTAILLAAARQIAKNRDFNGTVHLIFQPAEEGGGGAVSMMDDGLFERFPCDAVFALHNMPGMQAGRFVFRPGPAMASSDYATVILQGRGGHGALPQHTQDPIVAAASLVMALQTLVSRNVDPLQTAVVTVGAIHAGQANNVIPDQARLEISLRALDPAVRVLLKERLHALVDAQARSFGVVAQVTWRDGYAVLVNHETETALAIGVARELFGDARVEPNGRPLTGSEDFAFMLQRVPGSYVLVGNGQAGEPGGCMVHHPSYDFNDAILPDAVRFWETLAKKFLQG